MFCIRAIHGIEQAVDEPFLVILAVGAPGAAQDEQFDLVGGMPDSFQRLDAGYDLLIGIEFVVIGAHRSGFIWQIALGHAHIGRDRKCISPGRDKAWSAP